MNIVGPIHILNGQPVEGTCTSNACRYFDPSAFAPVTTAALGNAGRNILRGPGYFNLDASVMLDFKITERFTFQFEADALGLTNTLHFNNPTNNDSNADISRADFGVVTSTLVTTNASLGDSGGQRQWWFGDKVIF